MDIDLELDNLIGKYNIDTLGRQIYLEDAVLEVVLKYAEFEKIGLRCAGEHTAGFLKHFSDKIHIMAIFDKEPHKVSEEVLNYGIPVLPIEDINDYNLDVMIISTNTYKEEIKEELKNTNVKNIVDLYDEVEYKYGIKFDDDFYLSNYNDYLYLIGACDLYRNSKDNKETILRNIISSFLYNRDIYAVRECIKEYIEKDYTDSKRYNDFLRELNELMWKIKDIVLHRDTKDVIILWQDNLMYNLVENMPFEKSCRKKGMFFENARGVTVWTRAAMKAVLDKRLDIDNYYDTKEEHMLTNLFIDKGYECKYIGIGVNDDLHRNMAVEMKKEKRSYPPISKVYWNTLKLLVTQNKPLMVIAHSVMETHWPNYTPNMIDFHQKVIGFDNFFTNERNKRILDNLRYVDKETEYLISFLSDNSVKILMSDHGQMTSRKSRKWDYDAMHINFIVFGKDIPKMKCNKLFSLINFYELSKYILEPSKNNFDDIFSNEVLYQACPMYNKKLILTHIKEDFEEWGVSYRGVETLEDRYVLMETGKEIYNRLPDENKNYVDDEKFKDRVNYLRKKAGNKFLGLEKETTFENSYLLYDSLKMKGRI